MDAVIGFAHKGFFTPDAKLLANLVIFIGEQREVQQLFFGKAGELLWLIGADAQHFHTDLFQLIHVVA